VPFHIDRTKELDPNNLLTLCDCVGACEHHLGVGHTVEGKSSWKLFNPNVRVDAAKLLEQTKPNSV
jgi:predicted metal-binding protein